MMMMKDKELRAIFPFAISTADKKALSTTLSGLADKMESSKRRT